MRVIQILLGGLLLIAQQMAVAAENKAESPVDFMGIVLGQKFDMPECLLENALPGFDDLGGYRKGDDYAFSHLQPVLPCWRSGARSPDKDADTSATTRETYFYPSVSKTPGGVNPQYGTLTIVEGGIHVISVPTMGYQAQGEIFAQLVSKYGKPKTKSEQPIQNLAGATFNNIIASWKIGEMAQITFVGIAGSIKDGGIMVTTPEGDAYLAKERAKKAAGTPTF